MFENFQYECNVNQITLKTDIERLQIKRNFLINSLSSRKDSFTQINLDFDKFIQRFNRFSISQIKDPVLITYLTVLLEVEKELKQVRDKLNLIEKKLIDIKIYKYIIRRFNQLSKDWMINNGWVLSVRGLGLIRVRTKENKSVVNRINWGESIKFKNSLLKEGKVPFESIKNDKGEIIGNNGGIDWLIKISNRYDTWWFWSKTKSRFPNTHLYSFEPAKHTRLALREELNKDKIAYLKYF